MKHSMHLEDLKPSDYSAVLAVSVISYFDDGICFQLV